MIGIKDVFLELEELFNYYALENVTVTSPEDLNADCPFHEDDVHHHFGMNRESGLWNCFSCGAHGNIVGFVMRMESCDPESAKKRLRELSEGGFGIPITKLKDRLGDLLMDKKPTLTSEFIPYEQTLHPYLAERGFTEETAERWKLGWYADTERIVVPAPDEKGIVRGFILRGIRDSQQPRYLYTRGKWKQEILFGMNMIDSTNRVILTEGSLDTMWLWQHGYPAVALLGLGMGDRQLELLSEFDTVISMLDNDDAGKDALYDDNGLGDKMVRFGINLMCTRYPKERKDPQELSKEEIEAVLGKTRPFVGLKMRLA